MTPAVVVVPTTDCELHFALSPVVDHAVSPQGEGGDPWKARGISHLLTMSTWVAIDIDIGNHDKTWALVDATGAPRESVVGCLTMLFAAMKAHAPTGNLEGIGDSAIEAWAGWAGQRGGFASHFRRLFMDGAVVTGWERRNGKLHKQHEQARIRWERRREELRENSRKTREKLAKNSGDFASDRDRDRDRDRTAEVQKPLLRSHSLATESENGASHSTNGEQSASSVQPAVVGEATALSGIGAGSGQSARDLEVIAEALATPSLPNQGPYNRYSVDDKCRQVNELTRTSSETTSHIHIGESLELSPPNGGLHNPGRGGAVASGLPGGAENSGSGRLVPASQISSAISGDGTERHSVAAGTANPVAETLTRQKLPVPEAVPNSPEGDARGRPGDLARLAGERLKVQGQKTQERQERERFYAEAAEVVFAWWVKRLGHPKAIYDDKRRKAIERLLRMGSSLSDLLWCIEGAARDDYVMGRDPRHPGRHDTVEHLFRDRGAVEKYAQLKPEFDREEIHPLAVELRARFYAEVPAKAPAIALVAS